ncbi:MAG TPA: serine/threonine-protein kinase [Thermoanaerobaculia bacterium]|nr:serine/threonine-protein kinase [Thermoanaerobaculia bacterium]
MNRPLPQIEGKYEILQKIKEGGMGAVYKVRHRLLEEVRVVKTVRPEFAEDSDLKERFLREAKTAIRLRHPNIAQLYDFSLGEDGTAYIVMEYIDGVTLQEMLAKSGPPAVPLTLEIAGQGLEALAYLHRKGYVHRDVAPDNLMLTRSFDGGPQVKLIDLGIVKRLEGGGADLTATGTFLGKVRYAAPEQFSDAGARSPEPTSDIYSFGVMLYELLTGRLPFKGDSVSELIAGHLFRPPLDFDESDPDGRVPEALREIVLQAMAKDPAQRQQSAVELAARLQPLRAESATLREDLDHTLHTTTTLLIERGPVKSPGSTQGHLDRQFGLQATPRPESSKAAAEPAAGPRRIETRKQEVAALLANAQLLTRLEQFQRARHELDRLLEIEPRSEEGRELLEAVNAAALEREKRGIRRDAPRGGELDPGIERRLARALQEEASREGAGPEAGDEESARRREEAVGEAVRSIAGSLADGRFDRALSELELARKLYGEHAELDRLAERADKAIAADRALQDRGGAEG